MLVSFRDPGIQRVVLSKPRRAQTRSRDERLRFCKAAFACKASDMYYCMHSGIASIISCIACIVNTGKKGSKGWNIKLVTSSLWSTACFDPASQFDSIPQGLTLEGWCLAPSRPSIDRSRSAWIPAALCAIFVPQGEEAIGQWKSKLGPDGEARHRHRPCRTIKYVWVENHYEDPWSRFVFLYLAQLPTFRYCQRV